MRRQFGRSPPGAPVAVSEIGSGGGARLFGDTGWPRGFPQLRGGSRAFPFGSMPMAFSRLTRRAWHRCTKPKPKPKGVIMREQIHPHAAGIEIGATKIFVARSEEHTSELQS